MTVFVGPSIWRQIDVRGATAVFAAMTQNPTDEQVIWAPMWNDALIGRSRSLMCTEFLKTDADVMVILDDDIVFEPADFWKIIEGARETRGIYGGAYVTRSTSPHLSSRAWPNTTLDFGSTPQRRPVQIQYLATGFFAFHREVMEKLIEGEFEDAWGTHRLPLCTLGADRPFYPVFAPFVCIEHEAEERYHYLSEDWAFCNRARQVGVDVWCDTSIILEHMGLYPYTVGDIPQPGRAFPGNPTAGPSTGIDRMVMSGRPVNHNDPLLDTLVADLAEWAGESTGDVRRMMPRAAAKLNELFDSRPEAESEEDWYRRADVGLHYLADLAWWHVRKANRHMPLEMVEGFDGKTVLDFGAGCGLAAMAAARAGASVYAVEINPAQREFIAWRAAKHGIPLAGLDEGVGIRALCAPDVIVCWHVFEHLRDPEGMLRTFREMLMPGGLLISDSGFDDVSVSQHHAHSDWAGVLARHGFRETATPYVYELAPVAEAVTA